MSNSRTWRYWASLAPAAAALALLGGCVVAPTDPWDVGAPVVMSGSVYYGSAYGSYPGYYYYPAPSFYYPAPSYVRPGRVYRGSRPGYRRSTGGRGRAAGRPDRGQTRGRPATRPPFGTTPTLSGRPASRPRQATPQPVRNGGGLTSTRPGRGAAGGFTPGNHRAGGAARGRGGRR